MASKYVHVLIPVNVTAHGKRDFVDVIKMGRLSWIIWGPNVIMKIRIRERQEGLSKRRRCDYRSRDQNEVKKGS